MWVGIAQNLVMAVPAIFMPSTILRALGQTVPFDLTWVTLAALTLVVLACMYIPAAWNPLHYRWTVWLSMLARVPGVLFFWIWHPGHYPLFGWIDLLMVAVHCPSGYWRSIQLQDRFEIKASTHASTTSSFRKHQASYSSRLRISRDSLCARADGTNRARGRLRGPIPKMKRPLPRW